MKKTKSRDNCVLITGGAGYIGCLLAEKLAKKGLSVKIFDQFYFGKKPISHLNGSVEAIQGDIRKIPNNLFDQVSSVIHLAGLSNDPTSEFNPKANFIINTTSSVKLAKEAKKAGVSRFIFASSCSVYDLGIENEPGLQDETSPINPNAPYSLSKLKAEQALIPLGNSGFCVTILRKGTVFGFSPRMRYDLVVNTMVKNALSKGFIKVFCKGLQWRPLVDIQDVLQAYETVLETPKQKINKEIINISLDNFLVKDLAKIVQRTLKKQFSFNTKIIFEQDNKKDRSYRISTKKASKLIGFRPKISIEESVINLVNNIEKYKFNDFNNPIYYNIDWMRPILEKGI